MTSHSVGIATVVALRCEGRGFDVRHIYLLNFFEFDISLSVQVDVMLVLVWMFKRELSGLCCRPGVITRKAEKQDLCVFFVSGFSTPLPLNQRKVVWLSLPCGEAISFFLSPSHLDGCCTNRSKPPLTTVQLVPVINKHG